ncbi:unnamed protein product [Acanthoscelides obtectus]|uniref:Uncharacterized protein n=1 Tax=Acanthoscelides obtectus TaxID=200917 RepID=A0A9P0JTI1_ACAOB|nr:unnamed protein product [Acanthoscelides obtectus]CAK1637350.1 hypothetical protein AOBTE_LOCUS9927 [Acanthoscelides obtectus]
MKPRDEKENRQKNKGVNVVDTNDPDTCSCSENIAKIKQEVQTVIELMGPATPKLPDGSFSNTADTERTNELTYSGITNEKSDPCKKDCTCSDTGCTCEHTEDATTAPEMSASMEVTKVSSPLAPESTPEFICPPPFLPANVQFNSECMCPQMISYLQQRVQKMDYDEPYQGKSKSKYGKKSSPRRGSMFQSIFKYLKNGQQNNKKVQYYTMNVKHSKITHKPKRLVFELADRSPKCSTRRPRYSPECRDNFDTPHSLTHMKEHKNRCNAAMISERKSFRNADLRCDDGKDKDPGRMMNEKFICTSEPDNLATRMDVYYFDHGDSSFLRTTDNPPIITTEILAEKTEAYTTKFWAEMFGTVHIGISFVTSFILQLLRFLLYSIVRPLSVGLIQLLSDYFFKPFLATLFNAFVQPPMIFMYNVATSCRDLLSPIAEGIGYFFREISQLIRAFRLVEYKKICRCEDKNCCEDAVQDKCRDRAV